MRVELQQIQKNQAQQQTQNEQATPISFKKGEVVRATVLAKDGDTFVLKTQDGQLFKAKLQLDTVLNLQDQVEFVVTAKEGDKLSMQMISILSSGEGAQNSATGGGALLQSLGLSENAEAQAVLAAMQEMGITPSKTTLISALKLMQDTQLTAKESVFFAANQINVTEETIHALHEMQQGQTAGVVLFELAQEFAASNEQPQQAAQAEPDAQTAPGANETPQALGQEPEQSITQPSPSATPSQDTMAQTAQMTRQEVSITQPFVQEPVQAQPTEQPVQEQQAQPVQEQAQSTKAQPAQGQPAQAQKAQAQPAQAQQQGELKELTSKLLSMFVELDSAMDGAKVKKAAADTAFRSELLKDMMQSGDVRSRALAERMTDVAAQTKLTQDVQRFHCLHIPVHHQAHDTAELYIYKNKKGGKGIDPENTAILIGLATETMGRVESLIKVEKRNISLVFAVEEEQAVPFVKERARALYPLLRQHRYSLIDTKVNKLERPTTLTNAEEVLTAAVRKSSVYVDCKV